MRSLENDFWCVLGMYLAFLSQAGCLAAWLFPAHPELLWLPGLSDVEGRTGKAIWINKYIKCYLYCIDSGLSP